jgi:hypothetical protein
MVMTLHLLKRQDRRTGLLDHTGTAQGIMHTVGTDTAVNVVSGDLEQSRGIHLGGWAHLEPESLSGKNESKRKCVKTKAIFRSFEANSLPYLTKKIGRWDRFGACAADSFFARQALISGMKPAG